VGYGREEGDTQTLGGRTADELSANITKLNQDLNPVATTIGRTSLVGCNRQIQFGLELGGCDWLNWVWFFGILLLACWFVLGLGYPSFVEGCFCGGWFRLGVQLFFNHQDFLIAVF
jgi:hypothetical protein